MAVKNIVAENECDRIVADEVAPQNERMREPDRLVLHHIADVDAPGRAITEQMAIERQVLGGGNQQNILNAREHQHRQWVIDHRLVVDRQELFVDCKRRGIKPRAGATGQNNALHVVLSFKKYSSIVFSSDCSHGVRAMP